MRPRCSTSTRGCSRTPCNGPLRSPGSRPCSSIPTDRHSHRLRAIVAQTAIRGYRSSDQGERSMWQEFRTFVMRGNVIDLAFGIFILVKQVNRIRWPGTAEEAPAPPPPPPREELLLTEIRDLLDARLRA